MICRLANPSSTRSLRATGTIIRSLQVAGGNPGLCLRTPIISSLEVAMSNNIRDHLLTVAARAYYANYSLTMVEIGTNFCVDPWIQSCSANYSLTPAIHLFMALYGLSVFLETPKPLRKGIKRYIVEYWWITARPFLRCCLH